MKILVLSDLHREQWRQFAPDINPAISRPDVVVLAGDIDAGANAVGWARDIFPRIPVLYVAGNHEAYDNALEEVRHDIVKACAATSNVRFLDCSEAVFEQVRFIGCTLWTDFKLFGDGCSRLSMHEAGNVMGDYHRIQLAEKNGRTLRPADTARIHARQRHWLEGKLDDPFCGKTVVITHMAPSAQSIAERFATDPTSAAFASCLNYLVAKADLWIHGPTHQSHDYQIGKCRVVCNPCGYMTPGGTTENRGFDANFTVEI